MMKNLIRKVLPIAILAFFACLTKAGNTFAVTMSPETDLVIVDMSDDSEKTVKTRFAGNIPYVNLSEVWGIMVNPNLTVEPISAEKYTVKTSKGSGTVDTVSDILTTPNFDALTSKASEEHEPVPPSIKWYKDELVGAPTPATIDFSKYHIDLEGINDEIWLPAQTALDLIFEANFYDGEKVYLVPREKMEQVIYSDVHGALSEYYFPDDQSPPDFSSFMYGELCLIFDHLYGLPEKSVLSSSIKSSGLDYTLEHFDNDTKKIKEWLTSGQLSGFFKGLSLLNSYLYDGGHTGFDYALSSYVGYINAANWVEELKTYAKYNEHSQIGLSRDKVELQINNARTAVFGEDNKYIEDGDTAIFSFDGFGYDMAGWTAYYNGEVITYPSDTLGSILAALDRAAQNPNIRYFVFDVSTNTGGLGASALMIMSDLGFQNAIRYRKTTNNQIEYTTFATNADIHQKYNFKYGLIASKLTFSTGNLFTSFAKENGFLLLGETSGGGACSVKILNTVPGSFYSLSSPTCLIDQAGNSIDMGVEPDIKLAYQDYFDLKKLSALLNDFYAEETPLEPDEREPESSSQTSDNGYRQATSYLSYAETPSSAEPNANKTKNADNVVKKTTESMTKESKTEEPQKVANDEPSQNRLPLIIAITAVAGVTIVVIATLYKNRRH